ncbi:Holliday junction resolvase [Mycobacterium phage SrishMeg2525]|nr:Holliday junction resolvase [Mycobacterium phage SrishMeg2525]
MATCEVCTSEFTPPTKYNQAKTCSKKCRYELSARRNREKQGAHYLGKVCPQCGEKFDGKSTFCGRVCSNKYRSGDRHPRTTRVFPPCKVCGEPTQHTQRATCPEHRRGHEPQVEKVCPCGASTGSFTRLYCSDEHRALYGKKKAPTLMVEHICLGCGEKFERAHHYPGKKKYCSNRCAHREQKMTTEVAALVSNDRTLIFRSTWEMRFYCACLRFDIPIRSYDGPDIETSQGVYRPDFIIGKPGEERVVDVKGWLRPESEVKCREAGVHLVTKQELLRLESGDSLDAHRALLRNSGMNTHTAPLY